MPDWATIISASASGGASWTPLVITAESGGMWLRSNVGRFSETTGGTAVTTQGSVVKRWEDQSGNGNHVTQATDAKCLKYRNDSIAGKVSLASDWGGALLGAQFFNVPAGFTLDRRNCSVFFIARSYALQTQTFFNFGAQLAFFMDIEPGVMRNGFVTGPVVNSFNTLIQCCNISLIGTIGRSGDSVGYLRALSETGTALDSGTVTGGVIGAEVSEAYGNSCEYYEVIVVPREITAAEITSLKAYVASNYAAQTFTKIFLADGDSLTDGAYSTIGKTWPSQFGDLVGTSWQIYNFGVSGATMVDINNRRVAKVESKLGGSETDKLTACLGGTNDLGASASAATVDGRLATWHAAVRTAGSQKSFVYTIPARDDASWDGTKETERLALNVLIRANYNGASYGGPGNALVDLAADSRFQTPTDTTYYNADKLHFTNSGMLAIATLTQAQM